MPGIIELDSVRPIKYKDNFLIPIKADITKLFGTDKIEFQILIKDKKIAIECPKILASLDIQDEHLVKESINV